MPAKSDAKLHSSKRWAFWLRIYSVAIVAVAAGVIFFCWTELSSNSQGVRIVRDAILSVVALVGLPLAYWRGLVAAEQVDVARRQADVAMQQAGVATRQAETAREQLESTRKEQMRGRLQRASDMLSQSGISNSRARISALHDLRYLVRDEPDFGIEAVELITTFMVQAPVDKNHDQSEFALAKRSAVFIADTVEESGKYAPEECEQLQGDVRYAVGRVERKILQAGIVPFNPPEQ